MEAVRNQFKSIVLIQSEIIIHWVSNSSSLLSSRNSDPKGCRILLNVVADRFVLLFPIYLLVLFRAIPYFTTSRTSQCGNFPAVSAEYHHRRMSKVLFCSSSSKLLNESKKVKITNHDTVMLIFLSCLPIGEKHYVFFILDSDWSKAWNTRPDEKILHRSPADAIIHNTDLAIREVSASSETASDDRPNIVAMSWYGPPNTCHPRRRCGIRLPYFVRPCSNDTSRWYMV